MKIPRISFFFPGLACAVAIIVAIACTKNQPHNVQVSLNFDLGRERGPNTASDMDCFIVNVRGENTLSTFGDRTFNNGVTSTCLKLGTVSEAATVGDATTKGIKLQVRPGNRRTIEVLGYTGTLGTQCSGKKINDLLNQASASLYMLGSVTVDLANDQIVSIPNSYTTSVPDSVDGCKVGGGNQGGYNARLFHHDILGNIFTRLDFKAKHIHTIRNIGTSMYIGGEFEDGHGLPNADNLIIYDASTSTFAAPGAPLNGPVRAVAKIGSNLYIGGDFTNAGGNSDANRIAMWDGSNWVALDQGINTGSVTSLAAIGTNLYVGGTFDRINANTNLGYFVRWNEAATPALWETAGGGMGGSTSAVNALVKHASTEIIIGGDFTDAGGNSLADNIAKYDEPSGILLSVDPLAGLNSKVASLVSTGSILYAAGSFTDAGGNVASDKIAKFITGWGPVQNGLSSGEPLAVSYNGSQVFLGGDFSSVSGAPNTKNIGRFNGSTWTSVAGGLNGKVTAIDHYAGSNAFVGGEFDDGDTVPVP